MNRRTVLFAALSVVSSPASAFFQQPRSDESSALLASALKIALTITAPEEKATLLCAVADAQTATGDLPGALKTLALVGMYPERVTSLCTLAQAQAAKGDTVAANMLFQKAMETAAKIKAKSGSSTYNTALAKIAGARAAAGDLQAAQKIAALVKRVDDQMEIVTAIAVAQARRGDDAGALQTVTRTPKPMTDSHQYALGEILAIQTEAGRTAESVKTLELLIKDYATGAVVNGHDYRPAQVVRLLANAGDIDAAQKLTERLRIHSEAAVAHVFVGMAQQKAGDTAGAEASFASAREETPDVSDTEYLTELAQAQSEAGDKKGAAESLAAAEAMATKEDEYNKLNSFLRIATIYAGMGNKAGATKTFQTALRIAARGREEDQVKVAESMAQTGDFAGAILIASKLKEEYSRGDALAKIAREQAKAGKVAEALALTAKSPHDYYLQESYAGIVMAQCAAGDVPGAKTTLAKMDNQYPSKANALIALAKAVSVRK